MAIANQRRGNKSGCCVRMGTAFFYIPFTVEEIQMERPVKDHISHLEQRIDELNKQIIEDRRTQDERNRIESEIRAAELALVYYRKALELEQQVG
jgi:hypothetical protein